MDDNKNLDYNLPQNAYATFDATSLKNFIIQRLNENSTFTDQNYEGSNLASFIDIIAYSYHVLLFYLNQTSSETLFNQATLYENINRIVQTLNYKPTGKQTSIVPVTCVASADLTIDSYYLRKYSYFLIDGIQYTILDDFTFDKLTTTNETIETIRDNLILYQGVVGEYPTYTAHGEDYETFPIVVDNVLDENDERFVAHGTISVFVKEQNDDTWYEYTETENLFLNDPYSRVYDLRLNENGHWEIKFGNDTFGRKLSEGDEVAVYYILSDGRNGYISKNSLNGNKLFLYNSSRFADIYSDINEIGNVMINSTNNSLLTFTNTQTSTIIQDEETVEEIRQNTPAVFSTQHRLVTESDYEVFLSKNYSNVLNSIKVVNNSTFISEYIDYFYRICIDPNKVNRVILNQVNFADSCDFNNVNLFCCPNFDVTTDEFDPIYLTESLKNLLIDSTKDRKALNHEIVPRDPIYVAYDIGFGISDTSSNVVNNTQLIIVQERNNRISKETLKSKVAEQILAFFKPSNNELGQTLELSSLTASILKINGVKEIKTRNTSENVEIKGISFYSWVPLFPESDNELITQTKTLPFFKFPYFYRPNTLINKIIILDE